MNYILLKLNSAPCIISADDRLAYFGALDAFHQEGGLAPFIDFCRIQTLNTWEHNYYRFFWQKLRLLARWDETN